MTKTIISHKKTLKLSGSSSYGTITIYFKDSPSEESGMLSLPEFIALSNMLDSYKVGYNFQDGTFVAIPENYTSITA